MIESYTIVVQWGLRKESVEACAARTLQLLTCLARHNDIFSHWFTLGSTREEALQHEISLEDPATIQSLLIEGRSKSELRADLLEQLGYSIGLWTGRKDDDAGLSINCGCYAPAIGGNSCVLELPYESAAAEQLLHASVLEGIMACVVEAWNPDWGVVTSNKYEKIAPAQSPNTPWMGWMIYLAHKPETLPPLPAPVSVGTMGNQGSLITMTNERFTADNPSHIEIVNQVRDRLAQKGVFKSPA